MLSELGTGRGKTEKKGRVIIDFTSSLEDAVSPNILFWSNILLQPYQTHYSYDSSLNECCLDVHKYTAAECTDKLNSFLEKCMLE